MKTSVAYKKYVPLFIILLFTSLATLFLQKNAIEHRHSFPLEKVIRSKLNIDSTIGDSISVSFDEIQSNQTNRYSFKSSDTIIFVHIQKTGGSSFSKQLIHNLNHNQSCSCQANRKRCTCFRANNSRLSLSKHWLVNRYTTGWICGLHSDLIGFQNCISKALDRLDGKHFDRRFYFITFLRDPVARFLSEYEHRRRGATWKASRLTCHRKVIDSISCYDESDWKQVTLNQFLNCRHNFAINRMTLMLANLNAIDCRFPLNFTSNDASVLLESAKHNLRRLSFFGVLEDQKTSQALFEHTFDMRFRYPILQLNRTHSSVSQQQLSSQTIERIRQVNYLDEQLYQYAQTLLFQRFNRMQF